MKLVRFIGKALRDFALIFYDDLEFKAMSLPRLGAGILTALVVWVVVVWVTDNRMFPGFSELCALTGGIWATYLCKRRSSPPEENEHHGKNQRVDSTSG